MRLSIGIPYPIMIFYQIAFGQHDKDKYEESKEHIHQYLAALTHNGQIDKNYDIVPWRGQMVAYVQALGLKADQRKYHSKWGKDSLKSVQKYFAQMPVWTCNEDDVPKKLATWKNASFLYLFTHLFDRESSLCIGDDGSPLPYFRLPITDQEKDDIYCWTEQYRMFDAVWMNTGDLEIPAYRLLADPNSNLATKGRKCCEVIEKATGVPTYYYLKRYYGRKYAKEKERLCPGCGKPWLVERPEKELEERAMLALFGDTPFWEFDFRCDKCRLVSHFASKDYEPRYAKIGEPRKEKSKQSQ